MDSYRPASSRLDYLQKWLKYIASNSKIPRVLVYIKNRGEAVLFTEIIRALGYKGNELSFDDPHGPSNIWGAMEKNLCMPIGEMVAILDPEAMIVGAIRYPEPLDVIITTGKQSNNICSQDPFITFKGFMETFGGTPPRYIRWRDVTREAIERLDKGQTTDEPGKIWFETEQHTNDTDAPKPASDTQLKYLKTYLTCLALVVYVYIGSRSDAERFSDIIRTLGYKGDEPSFDDPSVACSVWDVVERRLGGPITEMVVSLNTHTKIVGAIMWNRPLDVIVDKQDSVYQKGVLITFEGFMSALDGTLPRYICVRDATYESIRTLIKEQPKERAIDKAKDEAIQEAIRELAQEKLRTDISKPTTNDTAATNNTGKKISPKNVSESFDTLKKLGANVVITKPYRDKEGRVVLAPNNHNNHTEEEVEMENNTTKNANPFGMSIKFGQCTDSGIVGTPLGIAVSSESADGTKSWHIYDHTTNAVTDLGNIDVGGFPVFMVPTTKPAVGDLIDQDGRYFYVTNVVSNFIDGIDPRTSEMITHVLKKNILGMSVYTKLVSIADGLLSDSNDGDDDTLLMCMAMSQCGQPVDGANAANSFMLPMLMMRKFGGTDGNIDEKSLLKMMAFSSMSGQPNGNASMNSLLPFLLMRKELSSSEKTENGDQGDSDSQSDSQ